MQCKDLESYLEHYGGLLGKQAQARLDPLHVPGRDPLPDFSQFLRKPFPAQQHIIAGTIQAMKHQKAVAMVAEMGTGKTLQAAIACHLHANGRPYRAIVFCPGQLTQKWEREILETIPNARVTLIEHCHQLNRLRRDRRMPRGSEWFIIARDRAKLGAKWTGSACDKVGKNSLMPARGGLRCPRCAGRLEDKQGNGVPMESLCKSQSYCQNPHPDARKSARGVRCGEPLWSYVGKAQGGLDRFEPAKYIHKRMRGFFDYLIGDEIHEEKGAATAQANAIGSLIAACKHVIVLTGTLIGGYAEHIRPLLFRMSPGSLIEDGLTWKMATEFNRRYGRIERTVTTRSGDVYDGRSNNQSRGSGRKVTESVKPGIVPTLFGRHLLGNSLYLSLAEVSDRLPVLREIIRPVAMDRELADEYQRIEDTLVSTNRMLCVNNNKALLGAMLQCLLCYPDLPKDWDWVGYWQWFNGDKEFMRVVKPADMDNAVRPKEAELIETIKREREQGRQCWVFVQYTDTRPVLDRIDGLLKAAGLRVKVLRASVPLAKREQWIHDNCQDVDVVISHPKLVETGLDLFDKKGGHNFCTLIFYETGYNLFTLRQASRRSWRIGQKRECRVYYLYYEGTAQAAAMSLMGKKLSAAQALEGKFSADGLVAMGGDDVSVEMALAQSLDSKMAGDAARAWALIADTAAPIQEAPPIEVDPRLIEDDDSILFEDTEELMSMLESMDLDADDEFDLGNLEASDSIEDLLAGMDDLLAAV